MSMPFLRDPVLALLVTTIVIEANTQLCCQEEERCFKTAHEGLTEEFDEHKTLGLELFVVA